MKVSKRLLCPHKRREVPESFSWLDHRLVREGHIEKCGPKALALYLFLVTVADADGLSYYGERSICRRLHLEERDLPEARERLCRAGLIAYEKPLYQVLALDGPRESARPERSGRCESIADILKEAGKGGGR